jgi:uncharacterized membrane protein
MYPKIMHSKIKLFNLIFGILLAAGLVVSPLLGATQASAAQTLAMSTSYPGISAKAGEAVSYSLKLQNNTDIGNNVSLSVDSIPDGWTGYFQANNSQISRVYVDGINPAVNATSSSSAGNTAIVTFNTTVPEGTQNGKYNITLSATGDNGDKSTLILEIDVSDTQLTASKLVSEYPELQGSSTTTFNFAMNLTNNSSEDQAYSLSAEAPDGWTVSFISSSDNTQIASLNAKAGQNTGLQAKITPPSDVTAGKYTIKCTATSGQETVSTDAVINITGTYSMEITTPSETLNADAYAGKETQVILYLQNTGSADLQNVSLTASAPTGWSVRFDPTSVDSVAAGQTAQVTAYISAASDAITGDYVVAMNAKADDASTSSNFRVTVKTSTTWGLVGVIIIVALILALSLIFKKFGRR